ncbi:heterokaryon incompatibility protein-domain-containing protein [Pisolithus tinctorius]|nr:heterokaryon incompatibility protein-domain-containing protein [Pisolithus tinctorius]
MKLLNVEVVLDREMDIQQAESDPEVLKELDDETTHYAILSHRWGVEVTYKEMTGLTKMEEWKRDEVRKRYGYQKIIKSCQQAMKDGYKWLWIDTCCIDKRSSSELSEAINSMYRWYRNAQVCYAYLNDVHESAFPIEQNNSEYEFGNSHGWPEWFARGWTLQELIAPKRVEFFNRDWAPIGNKRHLAPTLERITGIPLEVLRDGLTAKCLSVAQIMSWAADRQTSRLEDRAYSLMGLFGVNMPMLYGEGKKAFHRLQLEIIRISGDHSIFAWDPWKPRPGSVLAEDPSDFRDCVSIKKMEPDDFHRLLKNYIENKLELDGLRNDAETHRRKLAALRDAAHSRQFRTFTVSNAGIQVWLPVIPSSDSPSLFRATLACSHGSRLVTIDLISPGTSFDRTFGTTNILRTYPEFRTLYLSHHQNEMRCEFLLDDKNASYCGFTRCGTFPREFTGDTVALSSVTNDLIVIVYANNDTRSHFAVGIGYYLGQGWVHVINDERLASEEEDWKSPDFTSRIYDRMWNARAEHARSMPKQEHDYGHCHDYFIKHTHLPQSIWCARVIWGRWETDNFKIMVDVDQCPGCCDGPRAWTITSNCWSGLDMPGLMNTVHHPYSMELDGWLTRFDKFSGHKIVVRHAASPSA